MHETPPPGSQQTASTQRHICVVTETYPPEVNGVALTLAQLVKGLRAQGHEVSAGASTPAELSDGLGGGSDPR